MEKEHGQVDAKRLFFDCDASLKQSVESRRLRWLAFAGVLE